MDIRTIVEMEPEIQGVIRKAAKRACEDIDMAYVEAKEEADTLVGFGARNPALQSEIAYRVFIDHLCDVVGL